jgi:CheY-like chemotaxis protein
MTRILILEDNHEKLSAVVGRLVASQLVDHGSIETTRDAYTARKNLRGGYYDMFVLDLAVPERLGSEVDPNAGSRLLDDLLDSEDYQMPGQIVGLTGYEELVHQESAKFLAQGVLCTTARSRILGRVR